MQMRNLFLLLCCSLGIGAGALYFFPYVYPLISLDIQTSRSQALLKAQNIVHEKNLFHAHNTSVFFYTDDNVKTYVEFAGCGKDDLLMLLKDDLYQVYQWRVRFFEEKNVHESIVVFTPGGRLYGYSTLLSENDELPNVTQDEAQILAEQELQNITPAFAQYTCIEYTDMTQPCGRLDHTFVYERQDIKLHDAQYRLKAVVAGNKVIESIQFVKIPEKFMHEFKEMRAANTFLTMLGLSGLYGLYILLFGLFALYILFQKRQLIFYWPVRYGLVMSIVIGLLAELNQYSLWFMQYPTQFSKTLFLIQKLIGFLFNALFIFGLLSYASLVAESLTRVTFGKQVQLWKIFTKEYWFSRQVVEHIFVAYSFLGFFLAYEVFYIFMCPYFGMKNPTDSLMDPNILAHYIPSFTPLATAFFAGTWEEMICRAVPIAFVVWWSGRQKYSAKQKWYILIGAFILQSIIFGLLHADYPQQPSYSRVLELIPDSIGFGIVYVQYGLVPGMMAHFLYDALLMCMPIFVAPDLWAHQVFIILSLAFPLVWAFYILAGKEKTISVSALNESWEPIKEKSDEIDNPFYRFACFRYPQKSFMWAFPVLLAGIYACVQYPVKQYVAPLQVSKEQAQYSARTELEKRFEISLEGWSQQTAFARTLAPGLPFIWQEGRDQYQQYEHALGGAHWEITFVHFDGDLVSRQEKYTACIGPRLDQIYLKKLLPESFAANECSKDDAVQKAQDFIVQNHRIPTEQLELVSVENQKLPARIDWKVVFKDLSLPVVQDGYAQITVNIAGDQIVNDAREVKVPQEWGRDFAQDRALRGIFDLLILCFILAVILFLLISIVWFYGTFIMQWIMKNYLFVVVGCIVSIINILPYLYASLNTVEPLVLQWSKILVFILLYRFILFVCVQVASASVMVCRADTSMSSDAFLGVSYGIGLAGSFLYVSSWYEPFIPTLSDTLVLYSTFIPFVSMMHTQLTPLLLGIMIVYSLSCMQFIVSKKYLYSALLVVAYLSGVFVVNSLCMFEIWETIIAGSVLGLVLLALYYFVLSVHPGLASFILGTAWGVYFIQIGLSHPAPNALIYHSITVVLMAIVFLLYFNQRVNLQSEN